MRFYYHKWTNGQTERTLYSRKLTRQPLLETPCLDFAFPDYDDLPTLHMEFSLYSSISSDVLTEFGLPETNSTLWCVCLSTAWMSMPETPVHEDNGFVFG